jgi:restriction system protein
MVISEPSAREGVMAQQKRSLSEAIKVVLKEAGQPLHVKEIVRRVLTSGLWSTSGKTPQDTVSARLASDIKVNGTSSSFVRTAPNTYGLGPTVSSPSDKPIVVPVKNSGKAPGLVLPAATPVAQTLSFTDAAEKILDQYTGKQPLHYGEITKRAREHGLIATQGKTPEATMYAQILTEIERRNKRGETPRFVKHGSGLVSLTKWLPSGLVGQIDAHNTAIRKQLHTKLFDISAADFEQLVGKLLGALGFEKVQVTKQSGDGGIDVYGTLIVGEVISIRMAVQVKRWKNNVQAPTVQQVRGSLGAHDQGLIITTSGFSSGARAEAAQPNKTPVALMTGEQLVGLLIEHGIMVQRTEYHLLQIAPLGDNNP